MDNSIRKVVDADLNSLKDVVDSSGLFPSEYLEDMISDYLNNPDSEDIWFTFIDKNLPVGVGYCAPEKFTEGTYNLYAIGVKKELQGQGIGRQMMKFIEDHLKETKKRILIVETSSGDDFKLTREFYKKIDYEEIATIKDFWKEGDDKIIFWKKLN